MKKPSGRTAIMFLLTSAAIISGLVAASINPAETSSACMPEYIRKHSAHQCVNLAESNPTSIKVIDSNKR